MILKILITVIGLIVLLCYIPEKIKGASVKALILKSIVSCCFLALAMTALPGAANSFPVYITAGLFCGLMGDIWLDLKLVYPKDDAPYTFAGFIFFAIGHVLFIVGLILNYGMPFKPLMIVGALVISAIVGVAIVVMGPMLKLDYGRFKGISMVYAPLLLGTTLISLVLIIQNGFGANVPTVMFFGGVLFLASDLVLSGTYFGIGKDRPIDTIANYAAYYGAQFVIAWAAVMAGL